MYWSIKSRYNYKKIFKVLKTVIIQSVDMARIYFQHFVFKRMPLVGHGTMVHTTMAQGKMADKYANWSNGLPSICRLLLNKYRTTIMVSFVLPATWCMSLIIKKPLPGAGQTNMLIYNNGNNSKNSGFYRPHRFDRKTGQFLDIFELLFKRRGAESAKSRRGKMDIFF